jgi:hypothetical protein
MKDQKQKSRSGALVVMASPEVEDTLLCARVKKEIGSETKLFSKGLRFGIITGDTHGPELWADEYAVVNPDSNIVFLRVFSSSGICKTWKRSRGDGTGFSGDPPTEDRWCSGSNVSDIDHPEFYYRKWQSMLARSLVFDEIRVLYFVPERRRLEDAFVGKISTFLPYAIRVIGLFSDGSVKEKKR